MYDVFRVTAASVKKAKGREVWNIQLNNSCWASRLVPFGSNQLFDPLYKLYAKSGGSLDFLVGRYVATTLEDSQYGKNFTRLFSCDVFADFQKLLDEAGGRAFETELNMYDYLRGQGYPLNADSSITLKGAYSHRNIAKRGRSVICYPNISAPDTVTLENLPLIYKQFFEGKEIDTSNDDRDEQYTLGPISIGVFRRSFHKSKSGVASTYSSGFLFVGDKLRDEYRECLARHAHTT